MYECTSYILQLINERENEKNENRISKLFHLFQAWDKDIENELTFLLLLIPQVPCHHSWGRAILYLTSLTLPPLMRSQIAFILRYRIVFRPRRCICFRNECLIISFKMTSKHLSSGGLPRVLCSFVQVGVRSVQQNRPDTCPCFTEIVLLIEILTCTINYYGIFQLFLCCFLFVNDVLCQSITLPIVVVLNIAANKF